MKNDSIIKVKKLPIGAKVTLSVVLVQIPLLILATLLHLNDVKKNYLETIDWRAIALSQPLQKRSCDLSSYSAKMQRTLGLNIDCFDLLEKNRKSGFVHVGVINANGHVVAHTDSLLIDSITHLNKINEVIKSNLVTNDKTNKSYDVMVPVSIDDKVFAVIDIGFSNDVIKHKILKAVIYAGVSFLIILLVSFFLIRVLLNHFVIGPIKLLSKDAVKLAEDNMQEGLTITGVDEIDILNNSFTSMQNAINLKISELLDSEKDLKKARNYIANIIDSMPSVIVGVDIDGNITQWNKEAEKRTGHKSNYAFGKSLDKMIPSLSQELENIKTSINTKEEIFDLNRRRDEGSETFYEDITIYPLVANGVEGAVVRVDDVTEEYNIQKQLKQSQKMDAIGQLAGGIAHDFNNMLSGVIGAAELLQGLVPSTGKATKFINMILSASDRASDLAGKLLAFSRLENVGSTAIDMSKVVNDTVLLLQNTIDKRIEVTSELISGDKCNVVGDDSQLQSVFLNLGINASHAMPDGGVLRYRSEIIELDSIYCDISPFKLSPGTYVDVEVSDTGKGISEEDIVHIFEPFFTTKEQGKGTGLGLAAAFGTVQQHNGAITVKSELGKGTTFHFFAL
jgi:PAS domain S-box-containing protein